jgi:hypothetical protein
MGENHAYLTPLTGRGMLRVSLPGFREAVVAHLVNHGSLLHYQEQDAEDRADHESADRSAGASSVDHRLRS